MYAIFKAMRYNYRAELTPSIWMIKEISSSIQSHFKLLENGGKIQYEINRIQ